MKKVNSDIASDYIRKKILLGEYVQGHPLLPEVLSAEIKVSRTPVREALHRLNAEGLVTISPHVGASVKRMDLKEYREICQLRLAIEGYCAGLAALNRSSADLHEMKYALEAMRALTMRIVESPAEAPFIPDLLREDVRFHIAIITASGNDLMKNEILRLNMMNRLMLGSKTMGSVSKADSDANRIKVMASHDEIYEAIAVGDQKASREAMEAHFQDAMEKSLRLLTAGAPLAPRKLSEAELAYLG